MASTTDHAGTSMEDQAYLFAMLVPSGAIIPMALKMAIDLNILEIIAKAGHEAGISAAEIVSHLPTGNPEAASILDRILGFLSSYSFLTSSVVTGDDGGVQRRYGLAPISKVPVQNEDGVSISNLVLLDQHRAFKASSFHLKDAILDGGGSFERAHGKEVFDYIAQDEKLNKVFNKGMSDHSIIVMKKILEIYKGFEDLDELMDVSGGVGTALNMIISKFPRVKGLNFDLPHVVATAPDYPGIVHIGGDMFESISPTKIIFMKWILHDWRDELCLKILRNCYKALPDSGKIIVVGMLLPVTPTNDLASNLAFTGDLMTMAYNPGGKERTQTEFEDLAVRAGFAGVKYVSSAYDAWVMECSKPKYEFLQHYEPSLPYQILFLNTSFSIKR